MDNIEQEEQTLLSIIGSYIITNSEENSSSSSESSSSDSEEEILVFLSNSPKEAPVPNIEKVYDFVERVVPSYSRENFKSHFRLFPETFEALLSVIGPQLIHTGIEQGQKRITPKKQLLICLWFMATPDSYK